MFLSLIQLLLSNELFQCNFELSNYFNQFSFCFATNYFINAASNKQIILSSIQLLFKQCSFNQSGFYFAMNYIINATSNYQIILINSISVSPQIISSMQLRIIR